MKRLFLLLAVSALTSVSCSKKENNSRVDNGPLLEEPQTTTADSAITPDQGYEKALPSTAQTAPLNVDSTSTEKK